MNHILLAHAKRYPIMEPSDAVKLLYQSEFGGGHLIRDEEGCRNRLLSEYSQTPQSTKAPLLEDLGNGIVRVHLAALDAHGYEVGQLCSDFIRSSAAVRGSMDSFREKLNLLESLTRAGQMPFSPAALEQYLREYEAAGFPPVSHSDAYRSACHPAYRVVDRRFLPESIANSRML